VTLIHFEPIRPSVLGLPTPGCEVKMIPLETGKYELRVRGPNVTPGYWNRPDLNAAAFDDEGFYRIGDAGRFADPDDPSKGLEFAGRLSEDFKLTTGTWVHVGPLRVRAISALAPVAQDVVITGDDRSEVGFLIFPNVDGCRSLCPEQQNELSLHELVADPRVRDRVISGMTVLRAEGHGSSMYASRAIFLYEPPSHDAGEITDKGYINQRAVLARRASLLDRLYSDSPGEDVLTLT
ncbi:MAG: feruloyl-CoA synthase, partial [Blastocatellia bacterium]